MTSVLIVPRSPTQRASILDIAKRANVSPATVSRAFSQPELLRADTLARIQSTALEIGFRPNRVGRSLRSGRSQTVGLILPTLANPVFAECLAGAEDYARSQGYSVMVSTTRYDPDREQTAVQALLDHRVDALILTVADAARSPCLEALAHTGIPYVLAYNEARDHPFVSVDNRGAAGEVIDALASFGHRRIAFVSGPLSASDRARSRLAGARAKARKLGLNALGHLMMPAHTASDLNTLAGALASPQSPTALFCSNDLLAAAVIADLVRLGLRVPHDISVCGFDGMAFGSLMTPALSSLEQPNQEIGARACAHVLHRLNDAEFAPASMRLPHRLILGATIAAAPAAHSPHLHVSPALPTFPAVPPTLLKRTFP